jgi:hypothetical protein
MFWSIEIEDANARKMMVNIWKDDYTRWQEELKVGNFVSMRVRPPSGGFNTMTFESIPRGTKAPSKEEDCRLVVLKLPEKPKPVEINIDDFQFDPSAVDGLEKLTDDEAYERLVNPSQDGQDVDDPNDAEAWLAMHG